MARNTQQFETVVKLNAQQAQNELDKMYQRLKQLQADKDKLLKDPAHSASDLKAVNKEIKQLQAHIKTYGSDVKDTIETLSNLGSASVGEIEKAQRALKKQIKGVTSNEEFEALNKLIQKCDDRLSELKGTAELTSRVLQNLDGASLNDLQAAANHLREQMAKIKPDTAAYKDMTASLAKVQEKINTANASQKNSNLLVDQYNDELERCNSELNDSTRKQEIIDGTLKDISHATLPQIEYSLKMIKEQMKNFDIGSEDFENLSAQAAKLERTIERIKNKSKDTTTLWSRAANFLNKNWFVVMNAFSGLTGLGTSISDSISSFALMEDTLANVRKYTGQTDDEVRKMNEDFKRMDTRSSREQLNALAGSAGRLGIQSKQGIEEFVDAADKINVALGDDLGEGAVDKVGKLAQVFGEDERKGLRGAMLATGSAVNELAQNSSANAGYIVNFTADLAGVGRQANMTQAQIMGLASALDQNMQDESTASTVFSQLITKMFQDPAKFAGIARIEVKKFTQLLKTDANEALLQFMQAMQDKGGFDSMAPMFESMNLNGTRAVGVLSSVATHLDQVRVAQDLATREYNKGTSVLNEFEVNNNTVNAELDKAKKRFNDLTIELGQKLAPAAKYAIDAGSVSAKVVSALVGFVFKMRAALVVAVVTIGAYTVAVNASIIADKAKVLWTNKVVASVKRLWLVLKSNPYAAITAAIAFLITTLAMWTTKTDAQASALKSLNKIREDAAEKMVDEQMQINLLIKAAKDDHWTLEERRAALQELNRIIPGYNARLDEETGRYTANEEALRKYNNQLQRKYELEGAKETLKELGKQAAKASLEVEKANKRLGKMRTMGKGVNFTSPSALTPINTTQDIVARAERELVTAREKLHHIRAEMKSIGEAYEKDLMNDAVSQAKQNNTQTVAKTGTTSYKDPKKAAAEEKKRQQKIKAEQAAALKTKKANDEAIEAETNLHLAKLLSSYSRGDITRGDYIEKRYQEENSGLEKRMKLWDTESSEYQKLQSKQENAARERVEGISKLNAKQAESEHNQKEQLLKNAFNSKDSDLYHDEEALNEALFRNDQDYLEKRIQLAKIGSDEWFDLRDELTQNDNRHRMEQEQRYHEKLRMYQEQFGRLSNAEQEDIAIRGLKSLHEKRIIEEKEYQEMLKSIRLRYAKEQSENDLYDSEGERFKRNSKSAYDTASNEAKASYENEHPVGTGVVDLLTSDTLVFTSTLANIKKMEQEGVITHQEAMAAMGQATTDMCNGIAAKMQAAYDAISPIMSAMSSYYSAQSDYEVTVTEKKYDKLIEKAGNNTAKTKKLEEKKQKELAKIKTKYARKQMKMQIAEAVAQTAMSAISAYSSAMSGVPYPANMVLAPIAAGIALAAGAIQIATIKKQQQAQEAGYYEGGFTGGSNYRKKAGVVHEGEFVANHKTVNNPQLLPALRLIDLAQRNNTVGTLTATDVSRSMGVGSTVVAPTNVVVNTDNAEIAATLQQARDTNEKLGALLDGGIHAVVSMEEFKKQEKHWDNIQKRK